jgi:hypothetical protein
MKCAAVLGTGFAIALLATSASAQRHVDVGILTLPRDGRAVMRQPPIHVVDRTGEPVYGRHESDWRRDQRSDESKRKREHYKDMREARREAEKARREAEREYWKDRREAEREYWKDVREAQREYEKDRREALRDRRW